MPHELFLTIKQTTNIRTAFKIIQSDGPFGSCLGNLGKKALTHLAISLARDNLPGFVSDLASNEINKFQKNKWKSSCYSRKIIYFIYFELRYK